MDDINQEIADKLRASLDAGITDAAFAKIKKQIDDLLIDMQDDIEYRMKDDLAANLVAFVEEMARRTIDAILKGNETEMCRYLGCERGAWTGRSDSPVYGRERGIGEWHSVIHGELFEQGAIKLRRDIVSAHRELIASERIKDLEDQVASLVAQVNKAISEKEAMWVRVREYQ